MVGNFRGCFGVITLHVTDGILSVKIFNITWEIPGHDVATKITGHKPLELSGI